MYIIPTRKTKLTHGFKNPYFYVYEGSKRRRCSMSDNGSRAAFI